MKRLLLAATVAMAGACATPTSPSSYVCYTKPRAYVNPTTGQVIYERDHYVQSTPCPAVPID